MEIKILDLRLKSQCIEILGGILLDIEKGNLEENKRLVLSTLFGNLNNTFLNLENFESNILRFFDENNLSELKRNVEILLFLIKGTVSEFKKYELFSKRQRDYEECIKNKKFERAYRENDAIYFSFFDHSDYVGKERMIKAEIATERVFDMTVRNSIPKGYHPSNPELIEIGFDARIGISSTLFLPEDSDRKEFKLLVQREGIILEVSSLF